MPAQADYTEALNAIVKALNRPSTSPWLIVSFSVVIGFLAGIIGRFLEKYITEWHDLRNIRRILYLDIADLFFAVDSVMSLPDSALHNAALWREQELRTWLKFEREKYLTSRPDLYMRLRERGTAEFLYVAYHRILEEPGAMHVNSGLANRSVAEAIETGHLQAKYFRKYLNALLSQTLLNRADELYAEVQRMRAAMKPPSQELTEEGQSGESTSST
jgi:hypothetical protein